MKNYEKYVKFFDELEVDMENIRKMYLLYDFKTTIGHIGIVAGVIVGPLAIINLIKKKPILSREKLLKELSN